MIGVASQLLSQQAVLILHVHGYSHDTLVLGVSQKKRSCHDASAVFSAS